MEKKVIDQKEYLKRYLSGDNEKKKKKKKKSKVGPKTVKIIDDDIDLKNIRPIGENEFELFLDSEEAPQIVGIVDESATAGFKDSTKWKIVANDIDGDLTISSKVRSKEQLKPQKHSNSKRSESDDDLSPPRIKKHKRQKKKSESTSESDSSVAETEKRKKKSKSRKKESDSDLSPPRKPKNDESDLSPPRRRKNQSDSDQSPPRRKDRKISKDSDSDLSPPRKRKNHDDSDQSPPRRKDRKTGKDSDSDLSPPRKRKNHNDSDQSPPRRRDRKIRKDSDSDLSPPRRRKHHNESDQSPPRRKDRGIRKDSDSDLSPPRRRKHHNEFEQTPPKKDKKSLHKNEKKMHATRPRNNASDSDLSPPRRNRKNDDSDVSPPRRSKAHRNSDIKSRHRDKDKDSDISPPRHDKYHKDHQKVDRSYKHTNQSKSARNSELDLSPSHRRIRLESRNPSPPSSTSEYRKDSYDRAHKDRWKSKYDNVPMPSDRKDKHPKHSGDSRRAKPSRFESPERREKKMKKTLDGKTAGLQDAKALREETQEFKKREAEHFSKLSKEVSGVGKAAIVRDTKTGRKRDLEAEAAAEREKQKRQEEIDEKYAKWGRGLKQVEDRDEKLKADLHEMNKPLARYADDADLDKLLREQDREGDPMLDYIKQKQIKEGKRQPDRPVYEGSFMPNRFGIKPGHRWDGVDRSNGYEKKWFEARNAKIALQEDAYKWSTSDM